MHVTSHRWPAAAFAWQELLFLMEMVMPLASRSLPDTQALLAVALFTATPSVSPSLSGGTDGQTQPKLLTFVERIWWLLCETLGACTQFRHVEDVTATLCLSESPIQYGCLAGEDNGLMVETIGNYAVGLGGSSDVWRGRMLRPHNASPLVAVKVLRLFADGTGYNGMCKHLQREVRIWKLLDHESIAGFHGVAYNSNGTPAIISPWYESGSADVYLRRHPEINPMKLIWEIVLGVEYLHDRDIIHGDLKGANVMVDDTGHAKLIDFGLSRLIDSVTGAAGLTMTTVAFSVRWCAPELIHSETGQITKAIDVYAYASTALQLLTGDVPYGPQKERIVLMMVLNKVPPERPSTPPQHTIPDLEKFWELLECCWVEAERRPCISDVKERIRDFYSLDQNASVM